MNTAKTTKNGLHLLVCAIRIFLEFDLTRFLGELAWCTPICDAAVLNSPSLDIISLLEGPAKHILRYKEVWVPCKNMDVKNG